MNKQEDEFADFILIDHEEIPASDGNRNDEFVVVNVECSYLPMHILQSVFNYLPQSELLVCRAVCKDWKLILEKGHLEMDVIWMRVMKSLYSKIIQADLEYEEMSIIGFETNVLGDCLLGSAMVGLATIGCATYTLSNLPSLFYDFSWSRLVKVSLSGAATQVLTVHVVPFVAQGTLMLLPCAVPVAVTGMAARKVYKEFCYVLNTCEHEEKIAIIQQAIDTNSGLETAVDCPHLVPTTVIHWSQLIKPEELLLTMRELVCNIVGTEIDLNSRNGHSCYYLIETRYVDHFNQQHTVTVKRKYSQFVELHEHLSKKKGNIILPDLPQKERLSIWTGWRREEIIEERKKRFEQLLGSICERVKLTPNNSVDIFIEQFLLH